MNSQKDNFRPNSKVDFQEKGPGAPAERKSPSESKGADVPREEPGLPDSCPCSELKRQWTFPCATDMNEGMFSALVGGLKSKENSTYSGMSLLLRKKI